MENINAQPHEVGISPGSCMGDARPWVDTSIRSQVRIKKEKDESIRIVVAGRTAWDFRVVLRGYSYNTPLGMKINENLSVSVAKGNVHMS
jgi:hypothetical protein